MVSFVCARLRAPLRPLSTEGAGSHPRAFPRPRPSSSSFDGFASRATRRRRRRTRARRHRHRHRRPRSRRHSLVARHRSRARRESIETVGARPSRAGRPRRPIGRARDRRARDANASSNATKRFARVVERTRTPMVVYTTPRVLERRGRSRPRARRIGRAGVSSVCVYHRTRGLRILIRVRS